MCFERLLLCFLEYYHGFIAIFKIQFFIFLNKKLCIDLPAGKAKTFIALLTGRAMITPTFKKSFAIN